MALAHSQLAESRAIVGQLRGCHSPRRPRDRRPSQLCSAQRGQLEEAALMRGTVRQGRGEGSVRMSECAEWDSAFLYVSTHHHSVPPQLPGLLGTKPEVSRGHTQAADNSHATSGGPGELCPQAHPQLAPSLHPQGWDAERNPSHTNMLFQIAEKVAQSESPGLEFQP